MDSIFSTRTALVIGGSGGIGKAISLALAREGAHIIVHGGSSQERLDQTLQDIQNIQRAAGITTADQCHRALLKPLKGPESVTELLEQVPKTDILVISFGPFLRKPLTQLEANDWDYMTKMNLAFPGALVSAYLDQMLSQQWGRILLFGGTNTESIRGFLTTTAYAAAKTGLGVLAKSVARIGGAVNVTCNVICPGMIDTEYLTEQDRSYAREKAPGGTLITSETIANMAVEILKQPHLNGALIPIDNGLVI
ncbi:MAG: SDR family NAD(P)-dependent oxidoreductase [Treponema sp.]|nr:SDR family NAD(P)-dependent oxidoreductase [Treponema sp.]